MGKIFDWQTVFTSIPKLLKYLPKSLEITFWSMLAGLLLGLFFAIIKMNMVPILSQIVALLVSFLRGTPLIVQLFLSYNGVPLALKYYNSINGTDWSVNNIPAIFFVLLTFSLNEAAYNSESIRAALLSVDKGQIEAAESIGMSYTQVLRRIIIPEAFVVALPTLGNTLIGLLKGTSLAFVCSVVEMTAQAKIIAGANYRYFEVYLALALIYWVITIFFEQMIRLLEKHVSIPNNVPLRTKETGDWL